MTTVHPAKPSPAPAGFFLPRPRDLWGLFARAAMWGGVIGVCVVAMATAALGAVRQDETISTTAVRTILMFDVPPGSCVPPDPEPQVACPPGVKTDYDESVYEMCDVPPPGQQSLCDCGTVRWTITCAKGQGGGHGKGGKNK